MNPPHTYLLIPQTGNGSVFGNWNHSGSRRLIRASRDMEYCQKDIGLQPDNILTFLAAIVNEIGC